VSAIIGKDTFYRMGHFVGSLSSFLGMDVTVTAIEEAA
jgi:hypothetical protein